MRHFFLHLLFIFGAIHAEQQTQINTWGKVVGNNVRVRLKPDTNSKIICTLNKDFVVTITNEDGMFYQILAVEKSPLFVYKKFVNHGKIDGNNVNVRTEPNQQSTVITQLHNDDRIDIMDHNISTDKWVAIAPPNSVRYYISKNYVKSINEKTAWELIQEQNKTAVSESVDVVEIKKTFEPVYDTNINIDTVVTHNIDATFESFVRPQWVDLETNIYSRWKQQHLNGDYQQFLTTESEFTRLEQGRIVKVHKVSLNHPGDFILYNGKKPVAYIFSTTIDLNDYNNIEKKLMLTERPNNMWGLPAYKVVRVVG
jgi:hypothetical protein